MLLNLRNMFWGVPLCTILLIVHSCNSVPVERILEVPEGHTVKLTCESNDGNHTFAFWELASANILGPGNDYNDNKYEYDVLSGKLYVRQITVDDQGSYTCFSRDLKIPSKLRARAVRMIVTRDWSKPIEDDQTVSVIGVVLFVGCLIVLIGGGYLIYHKWSRQHRLQSLLEESEEEDESGDDVFTAPGTSKTSPRIIIDRAKQMEDPLSTDFESILSSANK